jgi:hypothetical protein
MAEPIIKTPTDARAGSKEGVVRYVLAISITPAKCSHSSASISSVDYRRNGGTAL